MNNGVYIIIISLTIVIMSIMIVMSVRKKEDFVNYQVNRQEVLEKIRKNEAMCDLHSTGMIAHDNEYLRRELRNNCNCGK